MKIKITTDSTCDLPEDIIEKLGISVMPLQVLVGDKYYRDGVDIKPHQIFEHVESGGGSCATTAINIADYFDFFKTHLESHDALIHINLSSELSACNQNANIAAAELENVYVFDSKNLSTGTGLMVMAAAEMALAGKSADEIIQKLDELAPKAEVSFVIDTLKYLHKGGRYSAVAALGANMLKLKPCIEVTDGKMTVGKKYRGVLPKVLKQYAEDKIANRSDLELHRIFITHSSVSQDIVDELYGYVKEIGFKDIIISTAGCAISCHCGPNALGLLYFRK